MNEYWEHVNEEALRLKDSHLAVERLTDRYRALDVTDRRRADEVLARWVLASNESKRFDAMALIRRFCVRSAVGALAELMSKLADEQGPGAEFEREKAAELIRELDQHEEPLN